jgi:uncharacterized membrane protein (DUF485 family)
MDHGTAVKLGKDNASKWKAKLGIKLFFVYWAIYSGFIIINTVKPKWMGTRILFGQNLAVTYGMGLIILAIIMGLIYNRCCSRKEDELNKHDQKAGGNK